MSSIWSSRNELLELIADWKAAYKAAAAGKSYTIAGGNGTRTLTRYDLNEIRSQLDWLEKELAALDGKCGPFFVKARVRRY